MCYYHAVTILNVYNSKVTYWQICHDNIVSVFDNNMFTSCVYKNRKQTYISNERQNIVTIKHSYVYLSIAFQNHLFGEKSRVYDFPGEHSNNLM